MKKAVCLIFFFLIAFCNTFSQSIVTSKQQAAIISDAVIELKQNSWYKSQAELWEENVYNNVTNANAWLNYYQAVRYSYYSSASKEIEETEQIRLDKILEEMGKKVSESFEYNYLKYVNSNQNPEYFSFLEKAYAKEPGNSETYDDFAAYYELSGNSLKKNEFIVMLKKAKVYPEAILNYNYNVLMSLDKNAILFTNGTIDTYPIWILQQTVRSDVTVLNMDLLKNKNYLLSKLESIGLTAESAYDFIGNPQAFYTYITSKNPEKNLYFSLTIPSQNLENISGKLFPTGLALKYSQDDFDNIKCIKNNWALFNTDSLFSLNEVAESASVTKLNLNYLIPIATLYKNYADNAEKEKAFMIIEQALILAKRAGKEEFVKKYFATLIKN